MDLFLFLFLFFDLRSTVPSPYSVAYEGRLCSGDGGDGGCALPPDAADTSAAVDQNLCRLLLWWFCWLRHRHFWLTSIDDVFLPHYTFAFTRLCIDQTLTKHSPANNEKKIFKTLGPKWCDEMIKLLRTWWRRSGLKAGQCFFPLPLMTSSTSPQLYLFSNVRICLVQYEPKSEISFPDKTI